MWAKTHCQSLDRLVDDKKSLSLEDLAAGNMGSDDSHIHRQILARVLIVIKIGWQVQPPAVTFSRSLSCLLSSSFLPSLPRSRSQGHHHGMHQDDGRAQRVEKSRPHGRVDPTRPTGLQTTVTTGTDPGPGDRRLTAEERTNPFANSANITCWALRFMQFPCVSR